MADFKNYTSVLIKSVSAKFLIMTLKFRQILTKRVPITSWLPKYKISSFFHDLLAGFTVSLTEIPQAIAYATVAGNYKTPHQIIKINSQRFITRIWSLFGLHGRFHLHNFRKPQRHKYRTYKHFVPFNPTICWQIWA